MHPAIAVKFECSLQPGQNHEHDNHRALGARQDLQSAKSGRLCSMNTPFTGGLRAIWSCHGAPAQVTVPALSLTPLFNDIVFALTRPIAAAGPDKPVTLTMRMVILAVGVLLLLSLAARAQEDAAEVRSAIEAQLEAFKSGDAQRAFSFASEQIQENFGTPENFIAMVRSRYAVVIAPASVVFLKPERANGVTLQPVQMSDERGQLWLALYSMQRDANGSWRINGCVLRRLQGSST